MTRTRTLVAVGLFMIATLTAAGCDVPTSTPTTTTTDTTMPTTTTPATVVPASCHQAGAISRNLAYRSVPAGVAANLVSLDVYRLGAGCTKAPVWIWVHGGGWTVGDKANQLADKIRLARQQGWILTSVNYRLTPGTTAAPVVWPTHNNDVASAVAWVKRQAVSLATYDRQLAAVAAAMGILVIDV